MRIALENRSICLKLYKRGYSLSIRPYPDPVLWHQGWRVRKLWSIGRLLCLGYSLQ